MVDNRVKDTPRQASNDPFKVESPPEYHVNDEAETNPDSAFEQEPLPKPEIPPQPVQFSARHREKPL
jgi:hypothetical protein